MLSENALTHRVWGASERRNLLSTKVLSLILRHGNSRATIDTPKVSWHIVAATDTSTGIHATGIHATSVGGNVARSTSVAGQRQPRREAGAQSYGPLFGGSRATESGGA